MGLKINTKNGAVHIVPQDGTGLVEVLVPRTAELASSQLDNVDNTVFKQKGVDSELASSQLDNVDNTVFKQKGVDSELASSQLDNVDNTVFLNKALSCGVLRSFRNRIINGDFQVNQRNTSELSNASGYVCDRVYADAVNAGLVVEINDVYSPNEGSLVSNTNPFGDSSQNNMYPFDTNSNDANGNNNGTDTKVDYVAGKFGGCLYTDQDNTSHVELDNIPKIFDETDKTLSCWVYISDNSGNYSIIASAKDSSKNSVRVNFLYNTISVYEGTNIDFPAPSKNCWNNLCFTVSSTGTKVYVNGKQVAEDSRTVINNSATASYDAYSVGNNWYNIANNNEGTPNVKIDQMRIFNRALNADEVKALYAEDLNYIQKKHLKIAVSGKDSSSNINPYVYKFEGQHIQDLINKDMTLSFEMLAPSGTYNVKLVTECLDGTTESFDSTFDIGTTGYVNQVIIIPKGTFTKRIVNDENLGATLYIANACDGNVNVGDEIKFINVQLEEGSAASSFEHVPYEVQLQRCLRYYEESYYGVDYYSNNHDFSVPIDAEVIRSKRVLPSTSITILDRTDTDVTAYIEFADNYRRFRANDGSANAPRAVSIHTKCQFDAEL